VRVSPLEDAQPRQKPAKNDGSRTFEGSEASTGCHRTECRRGAPSETAIQVESNRPPAASNHFHAISSWRAASAQEKHPASVRFGIAYAGPEAPAPLNQTSKWFRRNLNLPLAAGPRVRHIRADGAVAEWLKAAVC
jgi:hypothetical protein